MKIVDVESFYLRLPEIKDRTDSSQDALIVKVSTDEGVVGYGEVDGCPSVVQAIINAPKSHTTVHGLRELLIGEDPFDIERLWNKMYRGTLYYGREGAVIQAMAGVDLALWDLKGRALGVPVYTLLGGARRRSIPAYASHMFEFTVEATARRAAEARDAGFKAVKFGWEPFGEDAEFDEALVRGIRQAVGDDVAVMIDAGLAWDAKTAAQRCERLAPYRLAWLEEPLPPDDLKGYRKLTSMVSIPIAAGEEECTTRGFERLIAEGGVSVVQVDVTRVGLTQAIRVADLARQHGLPVCNHAFTTDINIRGSLHFLAAIQNALYLEYCVEPSQLRRGLTRNPIRVVDGMAAVPDEPGLGFELDPEVLERYLVAS